jgi:hypothetical protein
MTASQRYAAYKPKIKEFPRFLWCFQADSSGLTDMMHPSQSDVCQPVQEAFTKKIIYRKEAALVK